MTAVTGAELPTMGEGRADILLEEDDGEHAATLAVEFAGEHGASVQMTAYGPSPEAAIRRLRELLLAWPITSAECRPQLEAFECGRLVTLT